MREYVGMAEPTIGFMVSEDVKGILVEEYGYPDTLKTFGMAVLQHCFAGVTARDKPMLRPPGKQEHETLWGRHGRIPKELSFWINALIGAAGREKHMADMNYLFNQRLIEGRSTVFDL